MVSPILRGGGVLMDKKSMKVGELADLLESDIPDIQYHIDKIIADKEMTVFFGPGGHFKTGFCLYLGLCLSSGKDTFLYKTNKPVNVLWIDEEMGIRGLKSKATKLAKGLGITSQELKGKFWYSSIINFKIGEKRVLTGYQDPNAPMPLKEYIKANNIKVVFFDSLSRVFEGEENNAGDVAKIHNILRRLCEETDVSVVLIHHTKKSSEHSSSGKKDIEDMRGSSDFGNQVGNAFLIHKYAGNRYALSHCKSRYGKLNLMINFLVKDDCIDRDDESTLISLDFGGYVGEIIESKKDEAYVEIIKLFEGLAGARKSRDSTISMVRKEVKIGKTAAEDRLTELVNKGILNYEWGKGYKLVGDVDDL